MHPNINEITNYPDNCRRRIRLSTKKSLKCALSLQTIAKQYCHQFGRVLVATRNMYTLYKKGMKL